MVLASKILDQILIVLFVEVDLSDEEGELVPFTIGVFPPDPEVVYPEFTTLFRFRIVGLLIVARLVLVVKLDVLMIFLVLSETLRLQTTEYMKVKKP